MGEVMNTLPSSNPSFWEAYWQHVDPHTATYVGKSSADIVYAPTVIHICEHCGGSHYSNRCPRIKSIEYYQNGKVKRIEFHPPPVDAVSTIRIGPPWIKTETNETWQASSSTTSQPWPGTTVTYTNDD